jgi:hypothetical protein
VSIALDVMARDGYQCFRCGMALAPGGRLSNCHHRLLKSGGVVIDGPQNRITLCGFGNNLSDADGVELCHGWVHHHSAEARANGWIISRHATQPPELIPVLHHRRGLVLLTADYQIKEVA